MLLITYLVYHHTFQFIFVYFFKYFVVYFNIFFDGFLIKRPNCQWCVGLCLRVTMILKALEANMGITTVNGAVGHFEKPLRGRIRK